jgi:transposase
VLLNAVLRRHVKRVRYQIDEAVTALRALVEHREDLVRTRTQTVNRLHALLTRLVPAGLARKLTAEAVLQSEPTSAPKRPLRPDSDIT